MDGAISGVSGPFFLGSNMGSARTADGSITADEYTCDHGFFGVGRDIAGGSATGSLLVTNDLNLATRSNYFEVGYTFNEGLVAIGELSAGHADVLTRFALVGAHHGATTGVGNARGWRTLAPACCPARARA